MIIMPQSNNRLKLKNDIAFKAFFSQKENEEFLKDFLEAKLGEKLQRTKRRSRPLFSPDLSFRL